MKNNNKGFSLVELIVVIAIMAILAAVAVVGVSVYIPKAQQASDKQLIADIEDILLYEGYAGTFEEGESGYVVLSKDGVVKIQGNGMIVALTNAYGAEYNKEIKLAYDKWGNNGLLDGVSPALAFSVKNSSYMTGGRKDDLLGDVEIMTGMAKNLVDVLASGSGVTEDMKLSDMFTKDGVCAIDATAAQYGITKDPSQTWEDWAKLSDENNRAYSNLLVLTAADESQKRVEAQNSNTSYEMTSASNMILEFSSFYAYAAKDETFSNTLDTYMKHLNGDTIIEGLDPVTNAGTGAAWYNALKAEAGSGYEEYISGQQDELDEAGFLSIMAGLGKPTEDQASAIAGDISNANLFTSGVVNGMYNDYLDYVDAMSGLYSGEMNEADLDAINLEDGQIAVLIIQKDGVTEIKTTLPN